VQGGAFCTVATAASAQGTAARVFTPEMFGAKRDGVSDAMPQAPASG